MFRQKCLEIYKKIITDNTKIDIGHDIGHILMVEKHTLQALKNIKIKKHYPKNFKTNVHIAALLHEVGDHKLVGDNDDSKEVLLKEVLNQICDNEHHSDIIKMVDLCSASKWGNKVPENIEEYHLIPRWADRLEATGYIGLTRCFTFTVYKNRPIVDENDDFPSNLKELNKVSPPSRFVEYSNGRKSTSVLCHLLDKVRHINGNDVTVPFLKNSLNEGQKIIDNYILLFVNSGNKFDLDVIIDNLDENYYTPEKQEMKKIKERFLREKNPWIKG